MFSVEYSSLAGVIRKQFSENCL
uniref:Uncharacterized protein n=1 Tax=Rhizophora mucronata TaxID=61149 RepID=A0A2P2MY77_RHIMU